MQRTSQPAWAAGARSTARRRSAAGSPSSIVSFVIGGALGIKAPEDEQTYVGDSGKAHQLVDQHFPTENVESVIVQGRKGGSRRPAVKAAVDDTIAAVKGKPGVYDVESPYAKGNESQISKDGHSVLVNFKLRGDETQAEESVGAVLAAVERVQAANPASSSASSAARARTRRSRRPSRTTSRRPRRSRCRSR